MSLQLSLYSVAALTLEEQAATLRPPEILALLVQQRELQGQNAALKRQVEWFQRQLLGRKSQKRLREPEPDHLSLAGLLTVPVALADQPPPPTAAVAASRRRFRLTAADRADESKLQVDSSVPIQDVFLSNPKVLALPPDAYTVLGEKVTYRLAQRPGAYVLLKDIRPVIKRKDTERLICPPAPPAVFAKSVADVSVIVGLLSDKFAYHLPLYRQHQRLLHGGIRLSRGTLTQGGNGRRSYWSRAITPCSPRFCKVTCSRWMKPRSKRDGGSKANSIKGISGPSMGQWRAVKPTPVCHTWRSAADGPPNVGAV